jgi:iron(III) transport system permease protein
MSELPVDLPRLRPMSGPRAALPFYRRHRRVPLPVSLLAAIVGALTVVPVVIVVGQAASVGGSEVLRLLLRPRMAMLFSNTVGLTIAVVVAAALLGLGVAWVLERSDLPGRAFWQIAAAIPIAIPAFITTYGWVSLTPRVEGYWGALLILSLAHYPLVMLPVGAVLRRMDPALEEAARSLGHGAWRTFWHVTLPQTRPALYGGCLLIALHLFGEFGTFAMLRYPTLTTAIFDQYRLTFDGPAASLLATVVVLLGGLVLMAERYVRGSALYARLGPGTARSVRRVRLGRLLVLALPAMLLLVALAVGLPLAMLAYWLAQGQATPVTIADLLQTTWTTLRLGITAAILTTLLAIPIALQAVRAPGRLSALLERSTYLGTALPGLVVALALTLATVHVIRPLYQTTALLLVAYAILFLPLSVVAVQAALRQVPRSLEEAARSCGCTPLRVWGKVTMPLLLPGLRAATGLVFLSSITELTATLLLAPIGTRTLATEFWANAASLAYSAAAPYALVMVALAALPMSLLARRAGVAA